MTFETLVTFLTIENNNLNIHSDPWIKSDRDSIRNSCDVLISSVLSSNSLGHLVKLALPLQIDPPHLQCPCQRIRITDQDQAYTFARLRTFLDHTDLVSQYQSLSRCLQSQPSCLRIHLQLLKIIFFWKLAASTKFPGKCTVSCSCSLREHKV